MKKLARFRATHRVASRRVGGLLMVLATGAMAFGTSALFSATESNVPDSFTAGTVSVGLGAVGTTCNLTGLAPGDSSTGFGSGSTSRTPCTYNVKYTGSLPAYVAVDVKVLNGGTSLFTSNSSGLQFKIGASGGVSVVDGINYLDSAGTSTSIVAGTSVDNVLVKTTPAATGDEFTFTIDYALPTVAPNALQGGSATVQLTFHAVQSANQTTSCVAGRQCSTIVWG